MKQLFLFTAVLTLSFGAMAQGKGKAKGKTKKYNTEQTTTAPGTVAQKGNAKKSTEESAGCFAQRLSQCK